MVRNVDHSVQEIGLVRRFGRGSSGKARCDVALVGMGMVWRLVTGAMVSRAFDGGVWACCGWREEWPWSSWLDDGGALVFRSLQESRALAKVGFIGGFRRFIGV